jgi:dolichol-phosphate mannosyltransferase
VDIVFYFVLQLLGCPHLVARAISLWPATGWSWFFSRSSVGQSTRYLETRHGIAAIHLANFAINFGLYALLTTSVTFFMDHRVVALMVGAACASMISFAALTVFVYSDKRQ